jgi:hypothetical protein
MPSRIILAALLITIGVAGWILWPRIAQLLDGPAPTVPEEPAERDDQEERPASGADEPYAEELRAANEMLPSPDLRTIAEQMVADHEELGAITVALEEFGRNVTDAISGFLIRQPKTLLQVTGEQSAVMS